MSTLPTGIRKSAMKRQRSTSDVVRQVHFVRFPQRTPDEEAYPKQNGPPVLPTRSDDVSVSSAGDDTIISMVSIISTDSSQATVCHSNLSPHLSPPSKLSPSVRQSLTRIRQSEEKREVSPSPTRRSPSPAGRRPRNPLRSRRSFRSNSPRDTRNLRGHSSFTSSRDSRNLHGHSSFTSAMSASSSHSDESPRSVTSTSPRYDRARKAAKASRSVSPASHSNSSYGSRGRDEQPSRPLRRRLRTEARRSLSPGRSASEKDRAPFRRVSPRSAQSIRQKSEPYVARFSGGDDEAENALHNSSPGRLDHTENRRQSDPSSQGPKQHRRNHGSRRPRASKPSFQDKKSRASASPPTSRTSRSRKRAQGPDKQILLQLAQAKWNWNG